MDVQETRKRGVANRVLEEIGLKSLRNKHMKALIYTAAQKIPDTSFF
jgi:hypothetical protein